MSHAHRPEEATDRCLLRFVWLQDPEGLSYADWRRKLSEEWAAHQDRQADQRDWWQDEEKRWWKKYTTSDWVPSGARKEVYRGVKWWLYYRALAAWISKPEGLRPEGHRPEGHRPKAPDFVLKFLGLAVRVLV